MKLRIFRVLSLAACPLLSPVADAGCTVPVSDAEAFDTSRAVAEVEVVSGTPFLTKSGSIRTRFVLQIVRLYKGDLPPTMEIVAPGGRLGGRSELRSDSLPLVSGKSYVLLLNRSENGMWSAAPYKIFRDPATHPEVRRYFTNHARGRRPVSVISQTTTTGTDQSPAGVSGSVVTPTGYTESSGQPTRFTHPDGGEAIPYLVDIDPTKLPTGMTQAAAVAAVAEAVQAWAAVSALKFEFAGLVSFGTAASNLSPRDYRLRIQLHDNFNAITDGSGTLGIGGGGFESPSTVFTGGRVVTQGFQERLHSYVVMESPTNAPSLNDIPTFKRVLTHEIGHSLGLAHSSENPSEPDPVLKAATMYYTTGSGTAGATVQAYDVDRIRYGYPEANTPPYTIDRLIPAVTTDPSYGTFPSVAGVNRIQLRAIDLQGTALTASRTDSSSGIFTLNGATLSYDPGGFFGSPRLTDAEIQGGTFYDKAVVQFSDGVNLSRAGVCTVIGFAPDTTPSDGLPDDWMIANFGTKSVGALGSGRNPNDDPDQDGLENRLEFYLNTNPNNAASGPVRPVYDHATRRVSFVPIRFAPYDLESSTTLAAGSWSLLRVSTLFAPPGTLSFDVSATPLLTKEFYRVTTRP